MFCSFLIVYKYFESLSFLGGFLRLQEWYKFGGPERYDGVPGRCWKVSEGVWGGILTTW